MLNEKYADKNASRPPHGGRGLKFGGNCRVYLLDRVALPTEGVD